MEKRRVGSTKGGRRARPGTAPPLHMRFDEQLNLHEKLWLKKLNAYQERNGGEEANGKECEDALRALRGFKRQSRNMDANFEHGKWPEKIFLEGKSRYAKFHPHLLETKSSHTSAARHEVALLSRWFESQMSRIRGGATKPARKTAARRRCEDELSVGVSGVRLQQRLKEFERYHQVLCTVVQELVRMECKACWER